MYYMSPWVLCYFMKCKIVCICSKVYLQGTRISIFSSSQVSPLYSGVQLENKIVFVSFNTLLKQSTAPTDALVACSTIRDGQLYLTLFMCKPTRGILSVVGAHVFTIYKCFS